MFSHQLALKDPRNISSFFNCYAATNTKYFPCPPQKGFGNIDGEHWIGLDNIYNLGKQGDYKLMIELEDWTGKKVYAEYSSFHVESEREGYRLRLGTYQGNAGDSFSSHNGKQFTTLDRDKDAFSGSVDARLVPNTFRYIHILLHIKSYCIFLSL